MNTNEKEQIIMAQPRRVLVYGVAGTQGGDTEFIRNIFRYSDHKKIVFDVIPHGHAKQFYALEDWMSWGGRVFDITNDKGKISKIKTLRVFTEARANHDIVYFNITALYRIAPFLSAMSQHYTHIISHSHSGQIKADILRRFLHNTNRILVRSISERCFACSQDAGEYMYGSKFFDPQNNVKCSIIPNAINLERFAYSPLARMSVRSSLHINTSDTVFINVARFSPVKNQEYLVEIFSNLLNKISNSHLLLVGTGDNVYTESVRKKIQKLKLQDRVLLMGSRTAVNDLLSASDAFLLPSEHEGLPLALVEAQANGLRVFTYSHIQRTSALENDLVIAVDDNASPNKWVKIIQSNLSYSRNSRVNELSEKGFNIQRLAKTMENFFLSLK